MSPTVEVLANAGPGVGLGHVMRCLALAQALRDRGATVHVRTPDAGRAGGAEGAGEHLRRVGFEPEPWEPPSSGSLAILDGYGLDAELVEATRAACPRLLTFDDLVDPPPERGWILNGAPGIGLDDYPDLDPARLLLGPRFACLRPEFAQTPPRTRGERGLFLAGGAARPEALQALAEAGAGLVASGVLGAVDLVTADVPLTTPTGVSAVGFLDAPWEALADAAVVVSAGGQSLLEAACCGAPLVGYQLTADQARNLQGLATARALVHAGDAASPDFAHQVEAAVRAALTDRDLGPRAHAAVDGLGAARVAAALLEAPDAPATATLRPATTEDLHLLRRWRNDPAVVTASLSGREVTREEHRAWYLARLERPEPALWVATTEAGLPVGHLRLDAQANGDREVTISVAASRRGKGWGRALLAAAAALPGGTLVAQVRGDNLASLRLFEAAGYRREGEEDAVVRLRLGGSGGPASPP